MQSSRSNQARPQRGRYDLYLPREFLRTYKEVSGKDRPELYEREAAIAEHRRVQQRFLCNHLKLHYEQWRLRMSVDLAWRAVEPIIAGFAAHELVAALEGRAADFFRHVEALSASGERTDGSDGSASPWSSDASAVSLRPWTEIRWPNGHWKPCQLVDKRTSAEKGEEVLLRGTFGPDEPEREEWVASEEQGQVWKRRFAKVLNTKPHHADVEGKDRRRVVQTSLNQI